MKKFKMTLATAALAMLAVGSMLSMNSCKKDPCKDETCNDKGTPTANGDVCDCACNTGYEGDKCETEWSTKFVGSYNVTETGSATGTFSSSISANSSTEVKISNFSDSGMNINATLDAGSTLKINNASITVGGANFVANGTGSISGTTVTLNYTLSYGGSVIGTYTDTYVK